MEVSVANTSVSFVGIDVAKRKFDVRILPADKAFVFTYDAQGIAQLIERLREYGTCRIAIEATGRLERRLACELIEAGHHVAVVNPRQVRDFGRGLGILCKNDPLDARVVALFMQHVQPRSFEKPTEKQQELTALVTRRRQVIALQVAESNRLEGVTVKLAAKSIRHVLDLLRKELAKLDAEIARLIAADDDWRNKADLLRSVPGVGPATSASLVAELPELGRLNRQEIASLVGLAPSTKTAAATADGVPSGAAGARYAACSTWPH